MKAALFFAICLYMSALVVVNGLTLISSRTQPGESGEFPMTGTRVWIRTAGPTAFEPRAGSSWKAGDQVWDRFGTNAGLYNPSVDTSGPHVWDGIECRYVSPAHFATPVWQGCYNGFSDNETRTDGIDADYYQGRELCAVSSITAVVKRFDAVNPSGSRPFIENHFPIQINSWAQVNSWSERGIYMDLDNPPADYPAAIVSWIQYLRSFDAVNMTMTRIPGLGTMFTYTGQYQVFSVTILHNDGVDTGVIQVLYCSLFCWLIYLFFSSHTSMEAIQRWVIHSS